jgi:hypothetical protein
MSHGYRVGDVVRYGETWGVVRSRGFDHGPMVDWWVGQYNSHATEQWYCQNGCIADSDLSAPFAHDYAGIPDPVIARATMYQLTENI